MTTRPRRLHAYLETLPDGMRSFPRCQVRGEVLDSTLEWLADVDGELSPALRDWVRSHRPLGKAMEWIPEVLLNGVFLDVADQGYPSDQSCLDDVYRRQREVYKTAFYRALLMVLSPTLLTMGAADRWKAYRRGTELKIDKWDKAGTRRVTTATLFHPPGLYTTLNVASLAQALVAAIDAAGARDAKLELLPEGTPGETRFRLLYSA